MTGSKRSIIVADTSVLLNFLKIDRVDLLAQFSGEFIVTDHVAEEITKHYPRIYTRFQQALQNKVLIQDSLTAFDEVKLFGELMTKHRLGQGECAAIAVAIQRSYRLAIDDKRARNEALRKGQSLDIITTQELMVEMIQENLLAVPEADAIKEKWSTEHRFHLKFSSFADLL